MISARFREVGVIGLGYVGFPVLKASLEAGFNLIGLDIDEGKISSLHSGLSPLNGRNEPTIQRALEDERVKFTTNYSDLVDVDVLIIAVPTPLGPTGNPDLSYLESALDQIPANLNPNVLIVSESTSFPGTMRSLIQPRLLKKNLSLSSARFAVAPERIDPSNTDWSIYNTPRIVGGLSAEATKIAAEFYRTFCNSVTEVDSAEVAECAKLLENSFRLINIVFVNEFANYCRKVGVSTNMVIDAASTKPFGFMAFRPSIGVGGHCIPVDPKYLLESARQHRVNLEILEIAASKASNTEAVVSEIKGHLGPSLLGKKIQLVGLTYKDNVPDLRESPAMLLLKELRNEGALVTWHDPLIRNIGAETSSNLDKNIDMGLVLVKHDMVNLAAWDSIRERVFDLSLGARTGFPTFF